MFPAVIILSSIPLLLIDGAIGYPPLILRAPIVLLIGAALAIHAFIKPLKGRRIR